MIIHSVSLFVVRQQIQSMYFKRVFTPVWLTPPENDIQNPVQDALEKSKTYLGDICGDKIEFGGTKQKLLNAIFSTLCDAYLDRFIIAANNSMKLKLFDGK